MHSKVWSITDFNMKEHQWYKNLATYIERWWSFIYFLRKLIEDIQESTAKVLCESRSFGEEPIKHDEGHPQWK